MGLLINPFLYRRLMAATTAASTTNGTSPIAPLELQFLKVCFEGLQKISKTLAAEVDSMARMPEELISLGPAKKHKDDETDKRNKRKAEVDVLVESLVGFHGIEMVEFHAREQRNGGASPLVRPEGPTHIVDLDGGIDALAVLMESYKARRGTLRPYQTGGDAKAELHKSNRVRFFDEQIRLIEELTTGVRQQVQIEWVTYFSTNPPLPARPRAVPASAPKP